MFPHKYTSPTEQHHIWAWLDAVKEWQKIRPLDWARMPKVYHITHPHQNDPRVRREILECERFYAARWYASQSL